MRYTDVIFDFDGTLSDTYPCFARAFADTLHHFGMEDSYEHIYSLLKASVGTCILNYFPKERYDEINKVFHEYHHERAIKEQQPMEGARELLEFIRAAGGKNYIFSHSGLIVHELLDIWGMKDLFDGILDKSVKFKRKPDPEGIYILCDRYGLDKQKTLMVGDRDIDTDCGRNAGVAGCLFDPEHYYDKTAVDYRVMKLTDIEDIVK